MSRCNKTCLNIIDLSLSVWSFYLLKNKYSQTRLEEKTQQIHIEVSNVQIAVAKTVYKLALAYRLLSLCTSI